VGIIVVFFGLVHSLKLQSICIASLTKLGEFNASDRMRLAMCMVVLFYIHIDVDILIH